MRRSPSLGSQPEPQGLIGAKNQGLRHPEGAVSEGAKEFAPVEADSQPPVRFPLDDNHRGQLGVGRVAGEKTLASSSDLW